jgi:hypothetical protein
VNCSPSAAFCTAHNGASDVKMRSGWRAGWKNKRAEWFKIGIEFIDLFF